MYIEQYSAQNKDTERNRKKESTHAHTTLNSTQKQKPQRLRNCKYNNIELYFPHFYIDQWVEPPIWRVGFCYYCK